MTEKLLAEIVALKAQLAAEQEAHRQTREERDLARVWAEDRDRMSRLHDFEREAHAKTRALLGATPGGVKSLIEQNESLLSRLRSSEVRKDELMARLQAADETKDHYQKRIAELEAALTHAKDCLFDRGRLVGNQEQAQQIATLTRERDEAIEDRLNAVNPVTATMNALAKLQTAEQERDEWKKAYLDNEGPRLRAQRERDEARDRIGRYMENAAKAMRDSEAARVRAEKSAKDAREGRDRAKADAMILREERAQAEDAETELAQKVRYLNGDIVDAWCSLASYGRVTLNLNGPLFQAISEVVNAFKAENSALRKRLEAADALVRQLEAGNGRHGFVIDDFVRAYRQSAQEGK